MQLSRDAEERRRIRPDTRWPVGWWPYLNGLLAHVADAQVQQQLSEEWHEEVEAARFSPWCSIRASPATDVSYTAVEKLRIG